MRGDPPVGPGRDPERQDAVRPVEEIPARPAAERGTPAPDAGALTYADLDAQVAQAAAEVGNGLLDRGQAVARLALAARGRADLLDRMIETERRMADSALDRWPPTATALDLLSAARRVISGDTALVGPGGVRVEQTMLRTHDGPRTLLRLSRKSGPVLHRWNVEELAGDIDLATLTEDPRWDAARG